MVIPVVLAYLSGALPWAVWLGRLRGLDVRRVADRNPGAANAFRAGGWRLGAAVLALDFLKAFVPVLIARWGLPLDDATLFWVALMPTVGHAFSVFLGLRGGRALVTLFGVWAGLTLYQVPLVMGVAAIVASLVVKNNELRALAVPAAALVGLLLLDAPGWMFLLALAQTLILVAKIAAYYAGGKRTVPSQATSHAEINL